MKNYLLTTQIVFSILIIVAILLQAQGSSFGSNWSGGGETYHTRRGLEKLLFYSTIVMIILFALISVLALISK